MERRRIAPVALAGLLAGACCTPASRQMDRSLDFAFGSSAPRFSLVYAPVDEDVAGAIRQAVEEAISASSRWGRLSEPVSVYVYPDHESLIEAVGSQDYPWLRAWARYDEILLQSPRTWGIDYTEQLPELLRHELTHVVMYQRVARADTWEETRIPLWFREGMASVTARQGYRRSRPDRIGRTLLDHPELDPFEPGESLLRDQKDLVYNSGHWSFDYLVRLGGEERVAKLLDTMSGGATFEAAFLEVFRMTEAGFRSRWRGVVTGIQPPDAPALEPPAGSAGSSGDVGCPGGVRVEPDEVPAGGRSTVTVEVRGPDVSRPEPDPGSLDAVEVVASRASTSVQVHGERVVASHSLVLDVRAPGQAGEVSVGPFSAEVDGRRCTLPSARLKVVAHRGAPRPARRRPRHEPEILLRAPGEPIQPGERAIIDWVFPATVRRVRLLRPDLPGLWVDEELLADRVRATLEPVFFGEVTAAPLVALTTVGRSLFTAPREVRLESEPLHLTFLSPPALPVGLAELLEATAGSGDAKDRTAILALDLSSSLRALEPDGRTRLHRVGETVVALARALPATQRVGIVLYRQGAFTYLSPDKEPARLVDALGQLRWDDLPDEGTGTGAAILQAVRQLQPLAGRRHVLVLSGGYCGAVPVACSTAGRIAAALGVPVSGLLFGDEEDGAALEALALATGGSTAQVASAGDVPRAVEVMVQALEREAPQARPGLLRPSNLPLLWRRLEDMDRRYRLEYFGVTSPGETL